MKAVFVALVICMAPLVAFAQATPGTIKGSVRDLNGAPLAGATVYGVDLSRMTDRNGRTTTTSDSAGRFVLRDMRPGTYELRAYKESEGYPDTFFAFFYAGNDKNWKRVRVDDGQSSQGILLLLGPKYAKLKLTILDDSGRSVGAGLWFMKARDGKRMYGVGVLPNAEVLVPPVPFRFEIEKEGYEIWRSKLLSPQSGQTVFVSVRLKRSQTKQKSVRDR